MIPPYEMYSPRPEVMCMGRLRQSGLPEALLFRNHGIRPAGLVRWFEPFDRGFKDAEYRTGSWRKLASGVSLPLTFELVGYQPDDTPEKLAQADDNQLPVLPLFAFSMTATQILEKCTFADFRPHLMLSTNVEILDFRYGRDNMPSPALIYSAERGWLTKDDAKKTKAFTGWARLFAPRMLNPRAGPMFYVIVTLVTLSFAALMWRQWKQQKQTDRKESNEKAQG
ncbi:MAG: hypothetical protein ACLQM8_22075 [Limisphaerales bacterium]